MKFRQPDLNSAFYNSFYRGQNQNDRERERERRNTNGHFYENSVKNYKLLEPETRGISFCSEYKEYNAKIRKRFSNNLKKTYLNNFPPRSKT